MSCLSKKHRISDSREFNLIYKSGKKWHTHSFVAFFSPDKNLSVAFVASKKVGNAVIRNKCKRRLKALFMQYENKVISGKYIFVVKQTLLTQDSTGLKKDFDFAFKRLELFNDKKNI